ncbi:MAG: sigma-70 family RNA polymerase sigma factor [Clostridia bacterium]|nr:sigma-70 family RNA polymerase sigma factor [Clostridia bacterium]
MAQRKIGKEDFDPVIMDKARVFLEDYHASVHMLRLCREDARERERLSRECHLAEVYYGEIGGNEAFWLERMRTVRSFVEALPDPMCKMLLFYHYIRGLTVERASEELDISRRSAFRLKKKALMLAGTLLTQARAAG